MQPLASVSSNGSLTFGILENICVHKCWNFFLYSVALSSLEPLVLRLVDIFSFSLNYNPIISVLINESVTPKPDANPVENV